MVKCNKLQEEHGDQVYSKLAISTMTEKLLKRTSIFLPIDMSKVWNISKQVECEILIQCRSSILVERNSLSPLEFSSELVFHLRHA